MTIIAVANQKGGVGKTTLTIHLAVLMARAGRSVAIIDADPQANATSWLLGGARTHAGLFEALVVETPMPKLLRVLDAWHGMRLLAGDTRTGDAMMLMTRTDRPFEAVADVLRQVGDHADVVLIDMPPSRYAGFKETLYTADWVLAPTQLERLSMEGIGYMAETCAALAKEHSRAPRLLGIVPNMTRQQTKEHQAQMAELVAAFGPVVWPPIPLSVRVTEASAYGSTVFDMPKGDQAAEAFRQIGARVLEGING